MKYKIRSKNVIAPMPMAGTTNSGTITNLPLFYENHPDKAEKDGFYDLDEDTPEITDEMLADEIDKKKKKIKHKKLFKEYELKNGKIKEIKKIEITEEDFKNYE